MSIYKCLVLFGLLLLGINVNFSGVEYLTSKENNSGANAQIASADVSRGNEPDHRGSGR
ncbi:hypothetical protein [Oscillatoria sp. HE19RPO]|uniref:hypothetical protein n=1 Tax=Oscillatoria sp. HE19RPO TaxID=2954806 RepID=UPI0020C4414D|nr:hypothetical protein [Oscillatoria sp. HE19RPO]